MIVAIQQPEHLPWLGFFDKMQKCDAYIFLDNVQFKKRYFENRNKIRAEEEWQWITVPVISKGRYTQKINDVTIDYSEQWQRKYLGRIQSSYCRSHFYQEFYPALEGALHKNYELLVDLNIELINLIKEYFKIDTACFMASDLTGSESTGSDLILELCLKKEASIYLSGPDGKNYLNLDQFQEHGIKVIYHDYNHPEYTQLNSAEFIPYMSAVDYIFNTGNHKI